MNTVQVLSEALGVSEGEAARLVRSRSLRRSRYRGVVYFSLRRDYRGLPEGSVVLYAPGHPPRLVRGYPSISRILLLERAVERHFVDRVVVEEKMNGYNTRVVWYAGELLAITRGGFVCPYTTHRLSLSLGEALRGLFADHPQAIVAGESIGLENPYPRYPYPVEGGFGFMVFDIFIGGRRLGFSERQALAGDYGIPTVPVIDVVEKTRHERLRAIVDRLEETGGEGIILRDPENRVPPLKYTTTRTNIGDIEEGMRFFFEEGRSFIFPRVLREIFKIYEERPGPRELEERWLRLGRALLQPPQASVERVEREGLLGESFVLRFRDPRVLDESLAHFARLGIRVQVGEVRSEGGWLRVVFHKPRRTGDEVRRILETGLSPLD